MAAKQKDLTKKQKGIYIVVGLLIIFIIARLGGNEEVEEKKPKVEFPEKIDPVILHSQYIDSILNQPRKDVIMAETRRPPIGFRFSSAYQYSKGFPDMNDIQLATASRIGIPTIADRAEAVQRKDELVYIGENPFYVVDDLGYSIPYLIPRAARLLDEICRSFLDSLATRGLPFYKPFVTSVLRTQKDVKRLRRVNCNASANSCHQYGTTFDIAYNKFIPVRGPEETDKKDYWPAELKQILAEVLDDQRNKGTCYVRYEIHQSCFHITAR